jgi:hypothetical protein
MVIHRNRRRARMRRAAARAIGTSVLALAAALPVARADTAAAPLCEATPQRVRTAGTGAEDLVALPMPGGGVRLFLREGCRRGSCAPEGPRIGRIDLGADGQPLHEQTELAWRPEGDFEPLGLSLEADPAQPGRGRLTLMDGSSPAKVWRLTIVNGRIQPAAGPWFTEATDNGPLAGGNDLHAQGELVHVTRFDFFGLLRAERPGWPGLVRLQEGQAAEQADGLRGANGIVAGERAGERAGELIVADYWGRRLLRVDAATGATLGEASAGLPIHPDNLTIDRGRLWIAGQTSPWRTGMHLFGLRLAAPSAVYSIPLAELGPAAQPTLVWADGGTHAQAVSVAVPVPGGLALGQISAPDVLLLRCTGL